MFSQHLGDKQSLSFLSIRVQSSIPLFTTPLPFSPSTRSTSTLLGDTAKRYTHNRGRQQRHDRRKYRTVQTNRTIQKIHHPEQNFQKPRSPAPQLQPPRTPAQSRPDRLHRRNLSTCPPGSNPFQHPNLRKNRNRKDCHRQIRRNRTRKRKLRLYPLPPRTLKL